MQPLSIGPIALPNLVLLAPMSGVTDAPFRRMAAAWPRLPEVIRRVRALEQRSKAESDNP